MKFESCQYNNNETKDIKLLYMGKRGNNITKKQEKEVNFNNIENDYL